MNIIKQLNRLSQKIKIFKNTKQNIAFIPTMGNLHNGHIKLILEAQKYTTTIIVSIFINPLQFNCLSDFQKYPKNLRKDLKILNKHNVSIVFIPEIHEMYPNGMKYQTFVEVPRLSKIIEGRSRPCQFRGVTTIIVKLFNLIEPEFSFFGEKDYQQLLIIKTLIKDLNYKTKIISIPTVRKQNGLAYSSRNSNLTLQEIKKAPFLYQVILDTVKIIKNQNILQITEHLHVAREKLMKKGFLVDIFNIYDCKTLKHPCKNSKKLIILASVWLGKTRLIDNHIFLND